MPVHVDRLGETPHGTMFAIAHNYVQNGDVMADPDMQFLKNDQGVFPMTYQQDGLAFFQVGLSIRDGKLMIARKAQASMTRFANTWMPNIKEQQDLPC